MMAAISPAKVAQIPSPKRAMIWLTVTTLPATSGCRAAADCQNGPEDAGNGVGLDHHAGDVVDGLEGHRVQVALPLIEELHSEEELPAVGGAGVVVEDIPDVREEGVDLVGEVGVAVEEALVADPLGEVEEAGGDAAEVAAVPDPEEEEDEEVDGERRDDDVRRD